MNEQTPPAFKLRVHGVWTADAGDLPPGIVAAETIRPFRRPLRDYTLESIDFSRTAIPHFKLIEPPRETELDGAKALVYEYTGEPSFGSGCESSMPSGELIRFLSP